MARGLFIRQAAKQQNLRNEQLEKKFAVGAINFSPLLQSVYDTPRIVP
jgi:hypothetical protein